LPAGLSPLVCCRVVARTKYKRPTNEDHILENKCNSVATERLRLFFFTLLFGLSVLFLPTELMVGFET